MENTTKLPSGLLLVETPPSLIKVEVEPAIRCAFCRRPSVAKYVTLMGRTGDEFTRHRPTCGHEPFFTCPECCAAYPGCPVCGCGGEYT